MYIELFWEMSLFLKTFIGEATVAKLKGHSSISFILGNVILYWHKETNQSCLMKTTEAQTHRISKELPVLCGHIDIP